MTAPVMTPELMVGWTSEDEEGWWLVESPAHDDAGNLEGYWLVGREGVERFVSIERMPCYPWKAPL